MRKPSLAAQIQKQLLRAGFARTYASRTARELQEHWDELVDEGLRIGLSESDAKQEATRRLGSPEQLATEFTTRLQQSTWLGRNPTLAFAILPLMLTILWLAGFGSAAASACGLLFFDPKVHGSPASRLQILDQCFIWIRATQYLAVPWLCCWIAQRYFAGWRPALWACLIVAIHNAAHFFKISTTAGHGNVVWGYGFSLAKMPSLLPIFAPIAVFLLYRAWTLREQNNPEDSGPTFC